MLLARLAVSVDEAAALQRHHEALTAQQGQHR
jgi:hypothetical protein